MARFLPDCRNANRLGHRAQKPDDGQQLVDLVHQVALSRPSRTSPRAERPARSIFRARGFELTNTMMMTAGADRLAADDAYAAFHADLKRMKACPKTHQRVKLAPLVAEWRAPERRCSSSASSRQIMQLDVYDNPAGNYNAAIAGTSGSCKSLLLNEIAAAYLASAPWARVWIIDVGRSCEKACRNFGGSFIEFSKTPPCPSSCSPSLRDIDEKTWNSANLLLLAQMVSPRERSTASSTQRSVRRSRKPGRPRAIPHARLRRSTCSPPAGSTKKAAVE